MVALSVSISAITSPDLTLSPSFFSHLARLPFSIVGDSAGIRMLMGMLTSHSYLGRCLRLRKPTGTIWAFGRRTEGHGRSISDVALPDALVGFNRAPGLHHGDRTLVGQIDEGDAE